jgi:hypothetical protein
MPKGAIKKIKIDTQNLRQAPVVPAEKKMALEPKPAPTAGRASATASISNELTQLRAAAAAIQEIRLSAQRELEIARRIRADAQKYQQETATIARSQAQQLLLNTRLSTQKDTEELIRKASAEIQKVLADIRVIRITAQEELAAQRKFTDAARLNTLSLSVQKNSAEPNEKKKKQFAAKV